MIDWNLFAVGSHRTNCPACHRNPKDKTLGVLIHADGRGVAHCFRCELVITTHGLFNTNRTLRRDLTTKRHERLSGYGWQLWQACRPISGVAEAYLHARECVIPPVDGHLRWHPALKHSPTGCIGAALVALVTHAVTGEALTLHRTWISPNGTKADVDPPRMLLGNHSSKGGVIRLWPETSSHNCLGVGEGIETSLTLAHVIEPVWALIDAGHLSRFPALKDIDHLVIAMDRDNAGKEATLECAARWLSAGKSVHITGQEVNDLNDLREVA